MNGDMGKFNFLAIWLRLMGAALIALLLPFHLNVSLASSVGGINGGAGHIGASFEAPVLADGDSLTEWNDIPAWEVDSPPVDSGILNPNVVNGIPVPEGEQLAFLMSGDPSIYLLTDHSIAANEVFTLTFPARHASGEALSDVQYSLFYDDGVRVPVATDMFVDVSDGGGISFTPLELTFRANDFAASIGHHIGIEIQNIEPMPGSYLHIDDVRLDWIPEPSSIALACIGVFVLCKSMIMAKRRSVVPNPPRS